MTNATKTLFIIFISLAVLTALVKWTSGPSSSEAFRSTLVNVDTAQVNKIRIEQPAENRTVILQEENPSEWMVAKDGGGKQYEADRDAIRRALSSLTGLNVRAVVTRDPQKFTRYKVDSTGIKVSLFRDGDLLSSIVIGAPQFISQREFNNYVRPANEEAVYSVEGYLESMFNRNFDQWRDKQVWEIDRENITRVDFLLPADSSYSIERVDEQHWISRGDTLSRPQINSLLGRLSSLRAGGFVDSLSTSTFGTERYAIQLQLEDGPQRTIRLKPDDHDDSRFITVASDFPYVFTLNRSSWGSTVLKAREELLGRD